MEKFPDFQGRAYDDNCVGMVYLVDDEEIAERVRHHEDYGTIETLASCLLARDIPVKKCLLAEVYETVVVLPLHSVSCPSIVTFNSHRRCSSKSCPSKFSSARVSGLSHPVFFRNLHA